MIKLDSVCVFCGSNSGINPVYSRAAQDLGDLFATSSIRLIYGGGNVGLMGKVADTVMASGGEVVGVIPQSLAARELAHQAITELHVVDSMHARKALMAELADAFVALPGGFGTLEEICEVITWCQLGIHQKPCVLLNINGYFDPLLSQIERGVTEGFIRPEHQGIVLAASNASELMTIMQDFQPLQLEKWIGPAES